MPKKNKKRKTSDDSSNKENYSQNDNDSDYSNKEKESNKSDDEEISKTKERTEKSEKSEKSEQSLTEDQKKLLAARKQLHNMALAYDAQKEGEPFSSFLEKKRKAEDGIDQLAIDAKLDSDSIKSLTAFLEDNSFSKLNSDSDGGDEDYSPEKLSKPKRSENKKKTTKTKKNEKSEEKKNTRSNTKNKNNKNKNKKSETNNKKSKNKKSDKVLEGKIVTFTGSMMVSKEGLKQILVNLGAKITSTVSSNTNILIHGDYLEDGRSYDKGKKYKLAKKINLIFILIKNLNNIWKN